MERFETKMISNYGVFFKGFSYDEDVPYQNIMIIQYDENDYTEKKRKTLYFRIKDENNTICVVPDFNTKEEIEMYFTKYPCFAKLKLKVEIFMEI